MPHSGRAPSSRCFELRSPLADDPHRFVGWGPVTDDPPWKRYLTRLDASSRRLRQWLDELNKSGLQPVVDHQWLPAMPIHGRREAAKIVTARLAQIVDWGGGVPDWLLNRLRRKSDQRGLHTSSACATCSCPSTANKQGNFVERPDGAPYGVSNKSSAITGSKNGSQVFYSDRSIPISAGTRNRQECPS